MKLNDRNQTVGGAFKNACQNCYKKIAEQVRKAKEAIYAESRDTLNAQEHLLRLALNEAEALAAETSYPHLLFPTLAMEKVQAVANWNAHQQSIRHTNQIIALAA